MRRHKFNAKRTEVDGITFHSRKEARRYQELRLLEKAVEVRNLTTQPAFVLITVTPDGEVVPVGVWRGDFAYEEKHGREWRHVIEDVKGFQTALFKWKRKHVEKQYGITVRLT